MIINGERISGGINGPEAMLGTLVRVILDQVQRMRERYLELVPTSYPKRKSTTFSDLDESQALSCARDILLSCNRTESGGDTYLAIESLLVKKEFAVLTPLASEEEPLEIIVDIVESKRILPHRENSPHEDPQHHDFDHVYSSEMRSHPLLGFSKRVIDDYTDSSGVTHSVSTHEDDPQNISRTDPAVPLQYNENEQNGISHLESGDLSMPSDIEGATAIKSSTIHSKSTKRRTKDPYKSKLQGSGSVSESSNSDHSAFIEDYLIPDTSLEETSECAEDFDQMMSNSYDSGDSPPLGKGSLTLSPLTRMIEDEDFDVGIQFRQNSSQQSLPTSLRVSSPPYGNSDDITVDLSEVTMDSALKSNGLGHFSKAIKFVSGTPSKSRTDKGLLSQILKRNEGRSTVVEAVETKSRPMKKQTTLGGIRQALRPHKSSSKLDEPNEDTNPAAQSMCIRIQMIAKSKYRLCNLDPQNELEDNWAVVHGGFHQVFFLKSHSNGRPSMSDRLVTIKVVSVKDL